MADVLRETTDAWTRVLLDRDQRAAEKLLGEGFVLTSTGGVAPRVERDEWLVGLPTVETHAIEILEYEERTFGDVGVTRTLQRWIARRGGRDISGDYALVDVFQRTDGAWRPVWRISRKVT